MSSLEAVRARFAHNEGLPFANILTEASIRNVLNEHGVTYRDRVFNPVTTIWLSSVVVETSSRRTASQRSICCSSTAISSLSSGCSKAISSTVTAMVARGVLIS